MATAPCRSRTAASRSRRCLGSAETRPVAPSRPPDGGVWDRSPLANAGPRPPPTDGVSVTSCAVGSPAVRCKSALQLVSSAWVAGRQRGLFRAPGLPPGAAAVGKPPFRQSHGYRSVAGPSEARPVRRPTGQMSQCSKAPSSDTWVADAEWRTLAQSGMFGTSEDPPRNLRCVPGSEEFHQGGFPFLAANSEEVSRCVYRRT